MTDWKPASFFYIMRCQTSFELKTWWSDLNIYCYKTCWRFVKQTHCSTAVESFIQTISVMFSFFVLSWLTTGPEILSDLFKVYEAVAQRKGGILPKINSDWADHKTMAPLTFLRMVQKIKTFFWYSGSGVFPCQGSMTSKVSGVLVESWGPLQVSDVGVTCVFCKHTYTGIDTNTDTDTHTRTETQMPKHYHYSQTPTHTCTRPLRALRETLDLSNRNVLSRFDNFDFMTRPNERKDRLFGVAGGGTLLLLQCQI